jgi:hypothetical protein
MLVRPWPQRTEGRSPAARGGREHGFRSARVRRCIRSSPSATRSTTFPTAMWQAGGRRRSPSQTPASPAIAWRTSRRPAAVSGDEERAQRTAELGIPRRPAGHQRRRQGLSRPQRPEWQHGVRRHGEANICASGCVAGTGLYKSTNGGDTWTAHRWEHVRRTRHRRNRRQAGESEHDLRRRDDRPARDVVRVLLRRDPARAGCRQVGPLQVDQRRRVVELHPRRLGQRRRLRGRSDRVEQPANLLPSRRASLALDPTNPEIVYAASYARGVWRSPDGGATGRRSRRRSTRRSSRPGQSAVRRCRTARRGCTSSRGTRPELLAVVPERRRLDRGARVHD